MYHSLQPGHLADQLARDASRGRQLSPHRDPRSDENECSVPAESSSTL